MDKLQEKSIFFKIDMRSGYPKIYMKIEDTWKATARFRYKHYVYAIILFGVTNFPDIFMDYLNMTFHLFLGKFIFYIDGMLIYPVLMRHMRNT